MNRWLPGLGLIAATVACTPSAPTAHRTAAEDAPTPVASDETPSTPPVITTIQTRDHEITVYGTKHGLRFTVATAGDDTVLAQSLDELEFERSFPGLHQHFRTAFADGEGSWAGL